MLNPNLFLKIFPLHLHWLSANYANKYGILYNAASV